MLTTSLRHVVRLEVRNCCNPPMVRTRSGRGSLSAPINGRMVFVGAYRSQGNPRSQSLLERRGDPVPYPEELHSSKLERIDRLWTKDKKERV